jgi:hypothetical protein
MTSHPSPRPPGALRQRMIEDMSVRGFGEKTRNDYIRNVRAFAAFIGRSPDTAIAEDLRRFQLHQTQSGMQPPSINSAVSALRFFFTVMLDRPDLARRLTIVHRPRRLPAVLSAEEVALLLQAAPGPKYKAALATAGACPGAGRGRRAARLRGGRAQGWRCRLRAHAAAGRARQGARGPARHVVAATARTAARLVAGRAARRRVAAPGLVVSGAQSDRAAVDPPAQPCRSRCRQGRRDHQAGIAAHNCGIASPRICWNRIRISASSKFCSATPSSTLRRFTPASPTPRSAL